jgi:hypothetical protein
MLPKKLDTTLALKPRCPTEYTVADAELGKLASNKRITAKLVLIDPNPVKGLRRKSKTPSSNLSTILSMRAVRD